MGVVVTIGLVKALAAEAGPDAPLVHLLGHPRVSRGESEARLADSGMRLLAFVALTEGDIDRRSAASTLWPDDDDARAGGNLRTALWRVNGVGLHLVDATRTSLRLAERVQVDVRLLRTWAARVISCADRRHDLTFRSWDIERLDLLTGWHDDWLLLERERLHQRLLHALEGAVPSPYRSRTMCGGGRHRARDRADRSTARDCPRIAHSGSPGRGKPWTGDTGVRGALHAPAPSSSASSRRRACAVSFQMDK